MNCPADTGALYPSRTTVKVAVRGPCDYSNRNDAMVMTCNAKETSAELTSGVSLHRTRISNVARPWNSKIWNHFMKKEQLNIIVHIWPCYRRLTNRSGLCAYSAGTSKGKPFTIASSICPTYVRASRCFKGTSWKIVESSLIPSIPVSHSLSYLAFNLTISPILSAHLFIHCINQSLEFCQWAVQCVQWFYTLCLLLGGKISNDVIVWASQNIAGRTDRLPVCTDKMIWIFRFYMKRYTSSIIVGKQELFSPFQRFPEI